MQICIEYDYFPSYYESAIKIKRKNMKFLKRRVYHINMHQLVSI